VRLHGRLLPRPAIPCRGRQATSCIAGSAGAKTHKFTNGLTLSTLGSQSVTATDKSHSSITGSQTVTVQ